MAFESYIQNDFLRAFIILVALLLLIRIGLLIIQRIVMRLASKTKTDVDDILIKRSSSPLTLIAFFLSLHVAIQEIVLSESLDKTITTAINSFIIILIVYLIYVVVDVIVIRVIKRVASRTKSSLDDNLISLFHSVLRIALIIVAFLYILTLWGVQITPLLAGLGIGGLAVALALQPVLSNIFSGAAMVMDHSIRVGDLIYLDQNTKGKVEKIGLRTTRIRTFDNELLIVPNNQLADGIIQNVALPEPKSRVVVPFSVAYGSNIDKVKKLVLSEIKKIKHIEKDPAPVVRFVEMAASSLNFKAYYHVDTFDNRFESIDEANTRIYNILRKSKIEIPLPQMDVHLKKR